MLKQKMIAQRQKAQTKTRKASSADEDAIDLASLSQEEIDEILKYKLEAFIEMVSSDDANNDYGSSVFKS